MDVNNSLHSTQSREVVANPVSQTAAQTANNRVRAIATIRDATITPPKRAGNDLPTIRLQRHQRTMFQQAMFQQATEGKAQTLVEHADDLQKQADDGMATQEERLWLEDFYNALPDLTETLFPAETLLDGEDRVTDRMIYFWARRGEAAPLAKLLQRIRTAAKRESIKKGVVLCHNRTDLIPYFADFTAAGNIRRDELCRAVQRGCTVNTIKFLVKQGYQLPRDDRIVFSVQTSLSASAASMGDVSLLRFLWDECGFDPRIQSGKDDLEVIATRSMQSAVLHELAERSGPPWIEASDLLRVVGTSSYEASDDQAYEVVRFFKEKASFAPGLSSEEVEKELGCLTYNVIAAGLPKTAKLARAWYKEVTGKSYQVTDELMEQALSGLYSHQEKKVAEIQQLLKLCPPSKTMALTVVQHACVSGQIAMIKEYLSSALQVNHPSRMCEKTWRCAFYAGPEAVNALVEGGMLATWKSGNVLRVAIATQKPNNLAAVLGRVDISHDTLLEGYQLALSLGSLGTIFQLADQLGKKPKELVDDLFAGDMQIEQRLALFFLQSSVADSQRFLKMVSDDPVGLTANRTWHDYLRWAPFVGHYTDRSHQSDISRSYGADQATTFVGNQRLFGQKMRDAVDASMELDSLEAIHKSFWKIRAQLQKDRGKHDSIDFLHDRFDGNSFGARTPLYNPNNQRNLTPIDRQIDSRYAPFCSIITQTAANVHAGALQGAQKLLKGAYEIIYESKQGKRHNLTWLNRTKQGWWWHHTRWQTAKELWPRLEELHAQLEQTEVSDERFASLLTEGYWLGSHLMRVGRGNAQAFQNYLGRMCLKKGLHAPIPTKSFPQPDCVAISLPLCEFQRTITEFFDLWMVPLSKDA